jgi:hypothetical protein
MPRIGPVTNPQGTRLGISTATANVTTTSSTLADITGLSTTVTVGARPISVEGFIPYIAHSLSGGTVQISLVEDGTVIGNSFFNAAAVNQSVPFIIKASRSPSVGSHTYKLQIATFSGTATANMNDGLGLHAAPGYIKVVEE